MCRFFANVGKPQHWLGLEAWAEATASASPTRATTASALLTPAVPISASPTPVAAISASGSPAPVRSGFGSFNSGQPQHQLFNSGDGNVGFFNRAPATWASSSPQTSASQTPGAPTPASGTRAARCEDLFSGQRQHRRQQHRQHQHRRKLQHWQHQCRQLRLSAITAPAASTPVSYGAGYYNAGDYNTGVANTGNVSTGAFISGNYSNGFFRPRVTTRVGGAFHNDPVRNPTATTWVFNRHTHHRHRRHFTTPNQFHHSRFPDTSLAWSCGDCLSAEIVGPITIDVNQVVAIDSPIQQTISGWHRRLRFHRHHRWYPVSATPLPARRRVSSTPAPAMYQASGTSAPAMSGSGTSALAIPGFFNAGGLGNSGLLNFKRCSRVWPNLGQHHLRRLQHSEHAGPRDRPPSGSGDIGANLAGRSSTTRQPDAELRRRKTRAASTRASEPGRRQHRLR